MDVKPLLLIILSLTACSAPTDPKGEQTADQESGILDTGSEEALEKILGERIDGPANIRDTVNGRIMLTLHDNVLVETAPQQDNWCRIGMSVALNNKQSKELKIYPDTDLFSTDGHMIGKTKDTLELWDAGEKTGMFEAYTHVDNIKKHTIPEIALETEINKGNLTLSALKPYLQTFDFQDFGEHSDLKYRQFYIYESTVVDPSPRDRISLLFDNAGNLIAVVHSRQLSFSDFKTYDLVRGHSLTVFAALDKKEIQRIIRERKAFYNSVD